jgi:hypothetical protein
MSIKSMLGMLAIGVNLLSSQNLNAGQRSPDSPDIAVASSSEILDAVAPWVEQKIYIPIKDSTGKIVGYEVRTYLVWVDPPKPKVT